MPQLKLYPGRRYLWLDKYVVEAVGPTEYGEVKVNVLAWGGLECPVPRKELKELKDARRKPGRV